MMATLVPVGLPRYVCEDAHEQWSGRVLTVCCHGGCAKPVIRVCADGRRWTPRGKRE